MLNRLVEAACAGLERVISAVTMALLAVITMINALEIVCRSFFSLSFQWIYETNLLLASWMYFLGIYLVFRRSGDIAMVGLRSTLPQATQRVFDRAVYLVTVGVFAVVAWYSWVLIALQWPFRTPGVGIPRAAFTIPLLIGVGAIALDALRKGLAAGPRPDRPDRDKPA